MCHGSTVTGAAGAYAPKYLLLILHSASTAAATVLHEQPRGEVLYDLTKTKLLSMSCLLSLVSMNLSKCRSQAGQVLRPAATPMHSIGVGGWSSASPSSSPAKGVLYREA